jgi:hypothetical protein
MRRSILTTLTSLTALALALTPATAALAVGEQTGEAEEPATEHVTEPVAEPAAPPRQTSDHRDQHTDIKSQLKAVRHATAQYRDIERAKADGYILASECQPGMGFHFSRGIATNEHELEPTKPNILVYAPQHDGSLKLVAVEYGSESAATLFGHHFDRPTQGLPFYSLHAWLWEKNPDGLFNAENPRISCPA